MMPSNEITIVRRCSASSAEITHAPKYRPPPLAVDAGACVSSSVLSVLCSSPHNSTTVPATGAAAQSGNSANASAYGAFGYVASLFTKFADGAPEKLPAAMSVAVLMTVCAEPRNCFVGKSAIALESDQFGKQQRPLHAHRGGSAALL